MHTFWSLRSPVLCDKIKKSDNADVIMLMAGGGGGEGGQTPINV